MDKYYTPQQAARILRITRAKVYEYIQSGKLKAYKLGDDSPHRHWRISEPDIEAFIHFGHNTNAATDRGFQNEK